MSSILKALKKLEEEKRASLPEGQKKRQPAGSGRPLTVSVLITLVIGLVVGGLVTAWLFQEDRPVPEKSKLARTEARPVAPVAAAPAAREGLSTAPAEDRIKPSPVTKTVSGEDEFEPVVQQPPVQTAGSSMEKEFVPVGSASGEKPAEDVAAQPSADQSISEERVETVAIPEPGFQKTAPEPVADLPFVVSEIIYSEGSEANLAVVNDLPVMEGTEIDGVLVKAILADRVIFEVDGRPVEIESLPAPE